MATIELHKDNFRETYEKHDIVMIVFRANWCGPCKNFAPVYEKVSEQFPDILFGTVDIDQQPEIASYFGVRSVPFVAVIREKMELASGPGAVGETELAGLLTKVKGLNMEEVRKKIAEEEANLPPEE